MGVSMDEQNDQHSPEDANNNNTAMMMMADNEVEDADDGMVDDIDDTPEFLSPEDAVEVKVDDDDVAPMDEDDDDDDDEVVGEGLDSTNNIIPQDQSKLQFKSHNGPVYAITASTDPTNNDQLVIVTGGGDDRAYLHQMNVTSSLTGNNNDSNNSNNNSQLLDHIHTDTVAAVAINYKYVTNDLNKTPRMIAIGGYDGAIIIYNENGHKVKQLEGPTDIEWLTFHPIGGTVLLAGSATDGTVWMYHVVLNKCLQVFVGHETSVTAGGFTPDGKWAVTCSNDSTIRIWAPKTGQARHIFRFNDNNNNSSSSLICMDIGGGTDNKLVVTGSDDGQVYVCHVGTKKVVNTFRHYEIPSNLPNNDDDDEDAVELPSSVEAVGFCPSNHAWCASAGVDGTLKIWDLNNSQCRQICRDVEQQEGEGLTRLQWHPTLPLIFTSSTTGRIKLWDVRNGQLLQKITGGTNATINDLHVQFMNDNKAIILAAYDDNIVRVFDLDIASVLQSQ